MADDLDRIRGNVRTMIEKGAPEGDIDQYLAGEGVSAEMLRAAPETVAPTAAASPVAGAMSGAAGAVAVPTTSRQAKLDLQAAGSGLTSALAFPLDLAVYGAKGLNWGTDKVINALGLPPVESNQRTLSSLITGDAPKPFELPIPSEAVKSGVSYAAQKLGYEPAIPETLNEKMRSNIIDFAANAATGGVGLAKAGGQRALTLAQPGALPKWYDKFLRPYFESPGKAILGDVAAGGTAGAAVTGTQEIPKEYRDLGGGAVGAGADLTAMLLGGVGGGTLASALLNSPKTVPNAIRNRFNATDVPVNPVTGMPVSNKTADDVALLLQSGTTNEPMTVANALRQRVADFRDQGLPLPTTGLIADDIGLAGMEKRQRTLAGPGNTQFAADASPEVRAQFGFGARDQALRDAASERARSIRPEGADPEIFPQRAADVSGMRTGYEQNIVEDLGAQAAATQAAREAPATNLRTSVGATPGASSNIFDIYHDTRTLERDRSKGLYTKPEFTEHFFSSAPAQATAAEIRARATEAAPVTDYADKIIKRIESSSETGQLSGRELKILSKDIEGYIKKSLRDGEDFEQLKELKDSIARTITQLPAPHPARVAYDTAQQNYADIIQPNFREGYGGNLDMRLKTSPGQVAPETAGAGFFNRGQDAEQLMRIAGLRGNTQEAATNARAIIFDQLAQGGVIRNGVIDPDALTLWRNKRAHIIDQIPDLGAEINTMITEARQGAGRAARHADEIAAAEARLAQTTRDVREGPLGMVAGKTPVKAVRSVLESDNPPRAMAELKAQMGNDPAANQSLKAAVTDHFLDRIKTLDPHGDTEFGVKLNTLMKEFEKHRPTLAQVLTPEEMQALQQAQTILKPLTKRNVQATVGPTTAESGAAIMKPLELALKAHYGTLVGGSKMRNFRIALQLMRGDTKAPIEQLLTQTMFDPELAAKLLTRDVPKTPGPAWNRELQKLIRRNEAIKDIAKDDEN